MLYRDGHNVNTHTHLQCIHDLSHTSYRMSAATRMNQLTVILLSGEFSS